MRVSDRGSATINHFTQEGSRERESESERERERERLKKGAIPQGITRFRH